MRLQPTRVVIHNKLVLGSRHAAWKPCNIKRTLRNSGPVQKSFWMMGRSCQGAPVGLDSVTALVVLPRTLHLPATGVGAPGHTVQPRRGEARRRKISSCVDGLGHSGFSSCTFAWCLHICQLLALSSDRPQHIDHIFLQGRHCERSWQGGLINSRKRGPSLPSTTAWTKMRPEAAHLNTTASGWALVAQHAPVRFSVSPRSGAPSTLGGGGGTAVTRNAI
jgi:hypothetical protein